MKKRILYIVIAALLIIGIFYSMYFMSAEIINKDLDNSVVQQAAMTFVSKYYAWSVCNNQTFKDYGLTQSETACTSTENCREDWPWGISYKARVNGECCLDTISPSLGHCGEYKTT